MSVAVDAREKGLMPRLVHWHLCTGELALRLFLLQLLWVLGTLAGAVLLGVFPATAALAATLRDDRLEQAAEAAGERPGRRRRLWSDFWSVWRQEFWRSQRVGGVLLVLWLVLALDRWVLSAPGIGVQLGHLAPLAGGIVVMISVVLVLLSAVVWPLAAHFDDPVTRLLRMGLVLLVRRPSIVLSLALMVLVSVWLVQTVPGLLPVFGVALPMWLTTAILWRSGAMPLRSLT